MIDIRPLRPSDIPTVCEHRARLFAEAGADEDSITAMRAPFRRWLADRIADARFFGFVAEHASVVVGSIGLVVVDWPPHPAHPDADRRGYLLNLFVAPSSRRLGVARQLMTASEEEFRRRGIRYLFLHATDAGRPLYERSGWLASNEMKKYLA